MSANSVLAVIPARRGSTRLPGKHLLDLAGKPLIAHTIDAARDCAAVDRVIVTSDDERIEALARDAGVEFIARPAALATATATSEAALRHALETAAPAPGPADVVALLQPTSPLRTARHLAECIRAFRAAADCLSALSVVEAPAALNKAFAMEDGRLRPLFAERLSLPPHDLPPLYCPNGAIYLVRAGGFLETGNLYPPPVLPFPMTADESVDIDTEADFLAARRLLETAA